MNTTHPRRFLMTLLGLDPTEQRPTTRIRFALTTLATFATAVQIIAWLLIGIFSTHLDGPWWLWTPGSAVLINAALLSADHVREQWSHQPEALRTDDVTRESL